MKVRYSSDFYRRYKRAGVRIRKRVDSRISIFLKNPFDPQLNNHVLREAYEGLRSIDITSDWRAIYEEVKETEAIYAYFVALGTHEELYG